MTLTGGKGSGEDEEGQQLLAQGAQGLFLFVFCWFVLPQAIQI